MPPRTRTRKPAEPDEAPAPARHAKSDGEICADCWPNSWPNATTAAVCDHGAWTR